MKKSIFGMLLTMESLFMGNEAKQNIVMKISADVLMARKFLF